MYNERVYSVNWKRYDEEDQFDQPLNYGAPVLRFLRLFKAFRHLEYLAELRSRRIGVLEKKAHELKEEVSNLEEALADSYHGSDD